MQTSASHIQSNSFIPVCEPLMLGNETRYVLEAMETGWISSAGRFVTEFEKSFAAYCGVEFGVGVCNGTVALHAALKALGVGPGDEVIIPSFTMIATALAVCYMGATPVLVDADPNTWNMRVDQVEALIGPKTKGILPVHIFGLCCDMPALQKIAQKHQLWILEDAAEAHGASILGQKAGSFGDMAAFSFFANKNLTTGEGGMIVSAQKALFDKARYFKNMCFPLDAPREYLHQDLGFNYRISNLHAAIGLAQVEKADEYKAMRQKNAQIYASRLQNVPGLIFQTTPQGYEHVHWMNGVVLDPKVHSKSRDQVMLELKERGIDTRKFFIGMHQQPSLIQHGIRGTQSYTQTEFLSQNGFYLPSGSGLTPTQIEWICQQFLEILLEK